MIPVVWSERNELHDATGQVHDCSYSAILMCLIYAGKLTYPLGIYTAQEREALERSDAAPDEEGATPADIDLAILTRYGLKARIPASTMSVRAVLETPGLAVSVGGQLSNLPYGDPLRRYAPNYTGGHRITFLTSSKKWLDPLAPWKYAGDTTTVDKVVLFAKGRPVTGLRYLKADEFATTGGIEEGSDTVGLRMNLPSPVVAGRLSVRKGTKALRSSDGAEMTLSADATGREAYAMNLVNPDNSIHAKGYILDLTRFGVSEAWFVNVSDLPAGAFKPGGV